MDTGMSLKALIPKELHPLLVIEGSTDLTLKL